MEDPVRVEKESAKKGVETRLLIAGFVSLLVLQLWRFYVDELASIRETWRIQIAEQLAGPGSFPMVISQPLSLNDYFGGYGLKLLIPHDLILLAYSVAVVLSLICIMLLAKALLAVEHGEQEQANMLVDRGMRYFEWVLTMVIFFIIIHLMEESLFPFGTIFQENMWIIIGIAAVATVAVRVTLSRVLGKVGAAGLWHDKHPT